MADVFDVAAYILEKTKVLTAMKLQKLVYYAQAWSLVWDEKPLFENRIEAWANGPVTPDLYFAHQGEFTITSEPRGNSSKLTNDERDTVDAVLRDYGNKSATWLSALTHEEDPWINAREGVPDGQRSSRQITNAAMAEYYGNL
ncbi:type II toxin-antitoxin system antitoxin SocA domain-containing protein [Sphingomonas sp. GM_Shp_1]|uniref:Panacea domain-containing protein n=1 Tax=Sphingomonas sp. GM_Shp_1 TaxID=2937381 RepID=UPI00226BA6AC|nr:type II toxin-antitoxin system antitoxin SocA domain-containing protein [Sphingomonas sp. GM_Shp_1]